MGTSQMSPVAREPWAPGPAVPCQSLARWSKKWGTPRTSLVARWLRIRLPMQGTRVRALVRENPTCHGATKPVRHNYY